LRRIFVVVGVAVVLLPVIVLVVVVGGGAVCDMMPPLLLLSFFDVLDQRRNHSVCKLNNNYTNCLTDRRCYQLTRQAAFLMQHVLV